MKKNNLCKSLQSVKYLIITDTQLSMDYPHKSTKVISGLKVQFMIYPESCPGLWPPRPTSPESKQRLNLQLRPKDVGMQHLFWHLPFLSHTHHLQTGLKAWIFLLLLVNICGGDEVRREIENLFLKGQEKRFLLLRCLSCCDGEWHKAKPRLLPIPA